MPTRASASRIRSDFDAIARLTPDTDRLGPHEARLLSNLPSNRGSVLEIGCGVGRVARRLASSFDRVVAIDFSEGMIREAIARTDNDRIEYECAEMFEWLGHSPGAYDCIITIATLHHVDLRSALRSMAKSLKPGGRLLVMDLVVLEGWADNAVAFVAARARDILTPWKLRQAYWRHGGNETYLRLDEVRRIAREELPGSMVRGHLIWRYSLIWDKPLPPT